MSRHTKTPDEKKAHEMGLDSKAELVTDIGDGEEKVFVVMNKWMSSGRLGALTEGQVYKVKSEDANALMGADPECMKIVPKDKAHELAAANREKARADIQKAERKRAKQLDKQAEDAGAIMTRG